MSTSIPSYEFATEPSNAAEAPSGPQCRMSAGYELASTAVAIVFLIAGVMKARQLTAVDYVGSPWQTMGSAAAIIAEWLASAWLVSGLTPRVARAAIIGLLAVFLAVTSYRLFAGERDCGCFGAVEVPPLWTAAFDATALMALFALGRSLFPARVGNPDRTLSRLRVWSGAVIGVGLPAVMIVALARSAHARSGADLYCASPQFDFGTLSFAQASGATHDFIITNRSNHPIAITKLKPSCGCTTVTSPQSVLSPHSDLRMPVRVNWAGRTGVQNSTITVLTDNPTSPALVLRLTGNPTLPAIVTPARLNFQGVLSNPDLRRTVEVSRGSEGTAFRILQVRTSLPSIRVYRVGLRGERLSEVAGGPGRFEVVVAVPLEPGTDQGRIVFATDSAGDLVVPVSTRFVSALIADPPAIILKSQHRGAASIGVVRIRRRDGAGLTVQPEIAIVRCTDKSPFTVERTDTPGDGDHCVSAVVHFTPQASTGGMTTACVRVSFGRDVIEVPLVGFEQN